MAKIANPALAKTIAEGITASKGNSSVPLTTEKETKVYEHMQHHYDKEDKIVRQSCMKAAASAYNPPFGEAPEEIAAKIIKISEILFTWVNSK